MPTDDHPHHALAATLLAVRADLDHLSLRVQAALDGLRTGEPQFASRPGAPCARADRYRAALRDAVHTLERTRTSFKSKELGALRRSIEATLFDDPPVIGRGEGAGPCGR